MGIVACSWCQIPGGHPKHLYGWEVTLQSRRKPEAFSTTLQLELGGEGPQVGKSEHQVWIQNLHIATNCNKNALGFTIQHSTVVKNLGLWPQTQLQLAEHPEFGYHQKLYFKQRIIKC